MTFLYKVWTSDRQEKCFVIANERHMYEDLISKVSLKFNKAIDKIVLEKDGTVVDCDEVLLLLKEETFMALSKDEAWTSSSALHDIIVQSPPHTGTATTITVGELSDVTLSDISNVTSYSSPNMEIIWTDYQIPWSTFPKYLLDAYKEGQRNRRIVAETINLVVNDMRQTRTNIPMRAFKFAARRLADKYPDIFRDVDEDGVVVGDGFYSITAKLLDRNNYLNRPHKRSVSVAIDKRKINKLALNASAGCSHWESDGEEPSPSEAQKMLKRIDASDANFFKYLEETYHEQRVFLNNLLCPPTVQDIKIHWPAIFTTEGIFWHFEKVTSVSLHNIIAQIRDKSNKIAAFGRKAKNITEEAEAEDPGKGSLHVLAKHFNEDVNVIFCSTKTDHSGTNRSPDLPLTPCVLKTENCTTYSVMYEQAAVNDSVYDNPTTAFALAFAMYYILNLQYPKELSHTMEFVQRYYAKIHPDVGSKSRKKNTSKGRVISLINRLHNF